MTIDALDARLLEMLHREPRSGVLEYSRKLGVARGTVQARLDKMVARGIIRGFGPDLDPFALGYPVLAFTSLQIAQGRGDDVLRHLNQLPEVLEVHTTTAPSDLLCRIVARSNADLQRVLDRILEVDGITRTTTAVVLSTPITHRMIPLVNTFQNEDTTGSA